MTTMNISLPDDLKAFVEDRVAQEGYASASEYFRGLANSGGIAVHVGDQWPKLQMELWAIRTQG